MKLCEVLTGPETWCQGALQRGETHCLLGAVMAVCGADALDTLSYEAHVPLYHAIHTVDPSFLGSVAAWNDAPERTWEDIAAVVDEFDRLRLLACSPAIGV